MIFKLSLLFFLSFVSLFANGEIDTQYDSTLFTQKEISWLKKQKILKYVYDPDWAPFEWKNKLGLHTGIITDIIKIIEKKTHINFVAEDTDTWAKSVELVKNKKIHIFSAITQNKQRAKYLNFTKHDIISYSAVVITNFNDKSVYLNINSDMKCKRVGIVKGNGLGDYVQKKYKNLHYVLVNSTQDGLKMVANGEIDLFIINAITARYFIEKRYYDTLKIALKLDYTYHLKMGVSKHMPKELISILDKVLQNIPQNEYNTILNKWTSTPVEVKSIDWRLIIKIASLFLIIIIILMIHNRRLQKVVDQKTNDLKLLNKKLYMLAKTDSLTGLPNRRQLVDDFNNLTKSNNRNNQKFALYFLDIDGFKQVNDVLGHDAGDVLLENISNRIMAILKEGEKIYRIGGDEFLILIPSYHNIEALEYFAHRIIDEISNIYVSNTLTIGVSIGISLFPEDSKNLEGLINSSDKAMYRVKQSGKNNFYFSSSK